MLKWLWRQRQAFGRLQESVDMDSKFFNFIFFAAFALIILFWHFYGFVAYKAVGIAQDAMNDGGAKKLVEQIWCGKNGC